MLLNLELKLPFVLAEPDDDGIGLFWDDELVVIELPIVLEHHQSDWFNILLCFESKAVVFIWAYEYRLTSLCYELHHSRAHLLPILHDVHQVIAIHTNHPRLPTCRFHSYQSLGSSLDLQLFLPQLE